MSFNMYVPTRFLFGSGRLSKLHKQVMPGKKALLVISNGKSARASGALVRTQEQLEMAGVEAVIFSGIGPNPDKASVMDGAAAARGEGCDFIVALGGGSVMDAAKAIAMMATNDGDLWDYVKGGTGKAKRIESDPLPVVCITTTAGTGSEADQWGVVTNEDTHEKIGVGGYDSLFPVLSVIDPDLMMSVPPVYTAYQGFDTLFHAVECYISKFANLMSDLFAMAAIENVGAFLVRAVENGGDREARERMAFANTAAGIVMTLSVTTALHSLEHAMSGDHPKLPHGAGLIMLSVAFFSFFIDRHVCDERFVCMARALGMKEAGRPEDFITGLKRIQKDCGVDDLKMSDFGMTPDEFDRIAKSAKETMGGLFASNPDEMTHEDCVDILRRSYR